MKNRISIRVKIDFFIFRGERMFFFSLMMRDVIDEQKFVRDRRKKLKESQSLFEFSLRFEKEEKFKNKDNVISSKKI